MNDFRSEYEPWAFEPADEDAMRVALQDVLANWDKLPVGEYSPSEIQRWLNADIGPAVVRARVALTTGERPK